MRRRDQWETEPDAPESCPVCGADNSESISWFCSQRCEERCTKEQKARDDAYVRGLLSDLQEYPSEICKKILR